MNPAIREFATANMAIIWLIVLVGFVFLKVIKRRLED